MLTRVFAFAFAANAVDRGDRVVHDLALERAHRLQANLLIGRQDGLGR
jgi:hypothetical protein